MVIKELTTAEQLLHTTIRIETKTPVGDYTGTGFFFSFHNDLKTSKHIPVIITNKHVVKDADTGKLRFSLKDTAGNPIPGKFSDLKIDNFEARWIKHPENDIDLCALPIANIHREISKSEHKLYYVPLQKTNIPTQKELDGEYSRIEEIIVIGYPNVKWDSCINIPITRKGITATPLQTNFVNTPQFLIDAAIYGGSSGSPVFVFNQGSYYLPNGGLYAGTRTSLVGVVCAFALYTAEGEIQIVDIPAAKTPIVHTRIPNNLGVAIHAKKILDFESLIT